MEERRVPMRRCVGCYTSRPKAELKRYILTPDGTVFDPTGKKDGRGVYLCADNEACYKKAVKRNKISEAPNVEHK